MPKKTEPGEVVLPWDARGRYVVSMRATCAAVAPSGADWERVIGALFMRRTARDTGEAIADGAILLVDEPWTHGGHVLTINVHDGSNHSSRKRVTGVEAHWAFEVEPAPSYAPPIDVASRSHQAGGKSGAIATLDREWPAAKAVSMRVSASYLLDGGVYALEPQVVGMRPKKVTCASGATLSPRGVTLDVDGGHGPGLLTVEYGGEDEPFSLTWSGSAKVEIGPNLIETLDGAIWQILSQFVIAKNDRRTEAKTRATGGSRPAPGVTSKKTSSKKSSPKKASSKRAGRH